MNYIKIYIIFFVINSSDTNPNYDSTNNLIFKELNLHLNYTKNKINIFVSSTKKMRTSTGYYDIKNNLEINYKPSHVEEKSKTNFPISRAKRFLRESNCKRNESLKKIQENLDTTLKEKKIASGDVSLVSLASTVSSNSSINKQNQLFTNKNATTAVGMETLSFLKQDFNETNNETAERIKSSGDVKFLDVPPGGGMKVPELHLDQGVFVFSYVSSIVAGLQTADFPAGLFKDWLWNRLSFLQLIVQTIRVEGGIIALLLSFLLLALALPSAVLAHVSCHCRHCRSPCYFPSAASETHDIPMPDPGDGRAGGWCSRIVLVVVLEMMVLAMPLGMVGMFISNEHLSKSVERSPEVAKAVLEDMTTYVRNTHLQVRFVATTAVDQAVNAAVADLEDVELLLGRPIQRSLTIDTGIDVALDALNDICTASADIATEVLTLRAEAQGARDAARGAQDRLKELRRQVDQARRQCVEQDKVLCDTVDSGGLDVVFNVDKLLSERKLSRLRHLGEDNLTSAAGEARQTYQEIPQRVVRGTAMPRQEIKTILRKQREVLYTSTEALEDISRDFTASINVANGHVTKVVQAITDVEQWRWLTGLTSSLSILLIWLLLTTAVFFSHFNCSDRVLPLYIISLILICILSLVLWTVAAVALLLGGNGEVLICKPLYDEPNFTTMTDLLDNPGMVFKQGGMFSNILKGNDSLDVPVQVVLSECRLNQPAFPTFQLNRIFNIDSLTNHPTWPKLHSHFHNLSVNINDTQILKPTLQKFLQDLSAASRVNLTSYRQQLSTPVTLTDLGAFADHLERIAVQMHDLATSARMETLAARARKLLGNNLQRLEKHRDEIVYKLTALEVHLLPLQRQANQSLSHLKTIQYYLNSQGQNISEKKTREYVTRVVKYLERFREHVLNQLTYEVAPCRPLWDAYDAARVQLCKHVVEPMNIFWVSTVWCLILFILMTPFIMLLTDHYKYMYANGYLSRRELNELLLSDQGPWTTPHSTPESISTPEQQSSWTTPRRTSEQYLIPPPRRTSEPPTISPVPGTSFRRLIQTHMAPRGRQHDEAVGMSEPTSWRTRGIPSPRRWL